MTIDVTASDTPPTHSDNPPPSGPPPLPLVLPATLPPATRAQGYAALVLLSLGLLLAARNAFFMPATRWQYMTLTFPSEGHDRTGAEAMKFASITPNMQQLSSLGAQGWEVVASYLELETAFPNFGDDKFVTGLQPNVRPQRLVVILKHRLG